jgi:hypothetical protein
MAPLAVNCGRRGRGAGSERGRWGSHWESRAVVGGVSWAWWVADGRQAGRIELHVLILARSFYGGKCGPGGSEPRLPLSFPQHGSAPWRERVPSKLT